jgi:hypothetical protein
MAVALDIAWENLPMDAERSDATRRQLASIIIERFEQGEHDLMRLGNAALLEMAVGKVVESSGLDKPAA